MLERIKQMLGFGSEKPAQEPSAGAVAPPLSHSEAAFKAQPTSAPPLTHGEAAFKGQPATPPLKPAEGAYKARPGAEPPLAEEEPEK